MAVFRQKAKRVAAEVLLSVTENLQRHIRVPSELAEIDLNPVRDSQSQKSVPEHNQLFQSLPSGKHGTNTQPRRKVFALKVFVQHVRRDTGEHAVLTGLLINGFVLVLTAELAQLEGLVFVTASSLMEGSLRGLFWICCGSGDS